MNESVRGSLMSAHICAAIPNFILPTGPGWGVEVNQEVIRAHPPESMGRWER